MKNEVQYYFRSPVSQLSINILSKLGPKMVELFPPRKDTQSPKPTILVKEDSFSPHKTLRIEFYYENYYDIPCMVKVDLETKEVYSYEPNVTNGFATIKPHLEKILSEL